MVNNMICFSVGFCLLKFQEMVSVECPQCHCDKLLVKHIAPDLVCTHVFSYSVHKCFVLLQTFDDLAPPLKVDNQLLTNKKLMNKSGYGQVDRMILLKVCYIEIFFCS